MSPAAGEYEIGSLGLTTLAGSSTLPGSTTLAGSTAHTDDFPYWTNHADTASYTHTQPPESPLRRLRDPLSYIVPLRDGPLTPAERARRRIAWSTLFSVFLFNATLICWNYTLIMAATRPYSYLSIMLNQSMRVAFIWILLAADFLSLFINGVTVAIGYCTAVEGLGIANWRKAVAGKEFGSPRANAFCRPLLTALGDFLVLLSLLLCLALTTGQLLTLDPFAPSTQRPLT